MATTPTHLNRTSYLMPSLDRATVADAMHPGIVSCEPDATVTEVAQLMAGHHVHCIAVMGIAHDEPEELVWRIITDLDLVRAGLRDDDEPNARALALHPLITVESTTLLREAAKVMLDHRASHLVVTSIERLLPVGVLSTLDVVAVLGWGASPQIDRYLARLEALQATDAARKLAGTGEGPSGVPDSDS